MSAGIRGVPVYRQISPWVHLPEYIYSANDPKITDELGRWYPEDVATALADVEQGARGVLMALRDGVTPLATREQLEDALARLDTLQEATP